LQVLILPRRELILSHELVAERAEQMPLTHVMALGALERRAQSTKHPNAGAALFCNDGFSVE